MIYTLLVLLGRNSFECSLDFELLYIKLRGTLLSQLFKAEIKLMGEKRSVARCRGADLAVREAL